MELKHITYFLGFLSIVLTCLDGLFTYIGLNIGYQEGNKAGIIIMNILGVELGILFYVFIMILSTVYLVYMIKYKYWKYLSPLAILSRIIMIVPVLCIWAIAIWWNKNDRIYRSDNQLNNAYPYLMGFNTWKEKEKI